MSKRGRPKRYPYDDTRFVVRGILLVPSDPEKYIKATEDEGQIFTGKRLRELGFDVARLMREEYAEPLGGVL